jgi:NAD(P)H-nitrite reductase large subunit
MKHIVIIGNSLAGVKAIETLRAKDSQVQITLITFDSHLPYKSDLFTRFLKKEVSFVQMAYKAKDFYAQNNVRLLLDQVITRINVKRKRITFESKETLDYDYLILTDLPEHKFSDMKGSNKLGVYTYRNLKDIAEILKYIDVAETVVIETASLRGLEIAFGLTKYQKEVICVVAENSPLTALFDQESFVLLRAYLEEKGVRIVPDNAIVEVLGESDVKAVRLKSGKVLAASIVIFGKTIENFKIFGDSLGEVGAKLKVNDSFEGSAEGLFALGTLIGYPIVNPVYDEFIPDWLLELQGETVGRKLIGEGSPIVNECPISSFDFCEFNITVLGFLNIPSAHQTFQNFDSAARRFVKVYTQGGIIFGSVLMNAKEDVHKIAAYIKEKTNCQGQEDQLFGQAKEVAVVESTSTP